jgi:hypothetical protein
VRIIQRDDALPIFDATQEVSDFVPAVTELFTVRGDLQQRRAARPFFSPADNLSMR